MKQKTFTNYRHFLYDTLTPLQKLGMQVRIELLCGLDVSVFFLFIPGTMANVTTPLVPMSRVLSSLTVPSITVPACTPVMSPTITSPLFHPHPTSPGPTTAVYRGFPSLRDHRSMPYPSPYLRYNSGQQNEVSGYQSPPGTISSQ